MTRVFANAMVAHVWAQQSQPDGRSHNGNFYFDGPTLYSYGRHFPVGRFVQSADGGRAVLLNSNGYSVTTSAHKSRAWSAVYGLGLPIFHVPDCNQDHAENLRHFERKAVEAFTKADDPRRAKSRARYLEEGAAAVAEGERYASTFGVRWAWKGADATRKRWARDAGKAERERARLAAEREQREREKDAEAFGAWSRGESAHCPYSYATDEDGSAYLRVQGDELETSRGARVPLAHAVRAFRLASVCRERGEGWSPSGHTVRVGHFTVSEITAQGDLRAGCHFLSWRRMAEAARAAGVFDQSEIPAYA